MQETWVQSLGWEDPLEKKMATHSSILAWRIPRTIPWGHKGSDTTETLSLSYIYTWRICLQCERSGSIPGSERFPEEGNGNSLQYSGLGNSMNRRLRWATVREFTKSWTQLNDLTHWYIRIHIYRHTYFIYWGLPNLSAKNPEYL